MRKASDVTKVDAEGDAVKPFRVDERYTAPALIVIMTACVSYFAVELGRLLVEGTADSVSLLV